MILLEIGFIEEMRTTESDEKVPSAPPSLFPFSAKMNLTRLTPYHWQLCARNFCDIKKDDFAKFLTEYRRSPCNFLNWQFLAE